MIDGTIAPTLPTGQAGFRSGIENEIYFLALASFVFDGVKARSFFCYAIHGLKAVDIKKDVL
jgi:hypothetical protein